MPPSLNLEADSIAGPNKGTDELITLCTMVRRLTPEPLESKASR
jgi:hypothetical protein